MLTLSLSPVLSDPPAAHLVITALSGIMIWLGALAWVYRRRWLQVVANSDALLSRCNRAEEIAERYEREAAEEEAALARMRENIMRTISVKPSRIELRLPDAKCDSEAATEVMQFYCGGLEVEGE